MYTLLPGFNDQLLPWAAISDHNHKCFKKSNFPSISRWGRVSGLRTMLAIGGCGDSISALPVSYFVSYTRIYLRLRHGAGGNTMMNKTQFWALSSGFYFDNLVVETDKCR